MKKVVANLWLKNQSRMPCQSFGNHVEEAALSKSLRLEKGEALVKSPLRKVAKTLTRTDTVTVTLVAIWIEMTKTSTVK